MTDVALAGWDDVALELSPEEIEYERLRNIDPMPYRRRVDDFRDGTVESRAIADKARRYFDGDQIWGATELALKRSRQPKVIRNEIAPAINGILGVIQQDRVDPKAYPRTPANEKQADVATKVLRFIADKEQWHSKKVDCAESFLIEGVSAASIEVNAKGEPVIIPVPYDEAIYDPRSRKADFSDSDYNGVGKWMYEGDLARMYPWAAEDLGRVYTTSWGEDMGLERPDRPENAIGTSWLDPKKRRIFVVELYHRDDGRWNRCVFYVGGVLEAGPSPYVDDDGEPVCGIVLQSCLVTRDNQRAGLAKAMLSPQDELNAYGSRALHLARSRQIQASNPEFPPDVDGETAKKEAAKPDGAIPSGWEVVPTADLANGMQMMMADARQALVRQAPTPAVLSEAGASSASGRSKMVTQQAGMTEIARALGRLKDFENHVYQAVWLRAKQFKREPWFIRTSGDEDKKVVFEGVNVPAGPDGAPVPPELMGEALALMEQGVELPMANELAKMYIDIEVEAVPDTANLAAEQFETLAPLLPQIGEVYGPKKALELGLMLSAMPEKQKIKDALNAPEEIPPEQQQAAQAQAQQAQQMQEMQQQIAMLMAQAAIREKNAKAAKDEAAANEIQADTVLKAAQFQVGQPIDAQ
jgi:hypothetical protein